MTSIHTLAGRLGGDAILAYTTSGTARTTFNLAVDTGWGEYKKTTWWRVTLFGKTAENASNLLTKGMWVMVHGESYIDEWTGDDGKQNKLAKIDARDFTLPPRSATGNQQPAGNGNQQSPADGDIPF